MANDAHNIETWEASNDIVTNRQAVTEANDRRSMYERIARGHTLEAVETDARRKWRGQ